MQHHPLRPHQTTTARSGSDDRHRRDDPTQRTGRRPARDARSPQLGLRDADVVRELTVLDDAAQAD